MRVQARLALLSQKQKPWLVLEVNRDITDRMCAEAMGQEIEKRLAILREGKLPSDVP